ncbi:hypothetical protein [Rhodoblastus sp.]|nr:hypothetical protein [Rhodoblastus sp.]
MLEAADHLRGEATTSSVIYHTASRLKSSLKLVVPIMAIQAVDCH